jgi:hypothetical protein
VSYRLRHLFVATCLYCASIGAEAASGALGNLSLLDQTDGLPEDFREHFFDVPLTLRVERDGQMLGDAKVVLSQNNTVQLLEFTDTHESRLPESERKRWADYLGTPRILGTCEAGCGNDLVALHYSLESSVLSLVTNAAEHDDTLVRHHALPEGGSRGLILRNQLNLYGDQNANRGGSYRLDAEGSIGLWTVTGNYQVDRGAGSGTDWRHSVQGLYAQREHKDHFVRLGYFQPNFQGVARQPVTPNAVVHTTVGIMAGSSDSLAIDSDNPSMYPLYVTANRQGTVELYRNGALIYTQQLEPGLQLIDTRRLPGGIYEVEMRVLEDGQVTSRQNELVYKPSHWRNPEQRWRYSAFAGQQRTLLDSRTDPREGDLAVGAVVNYLAHARAVVGLSAQQTGSEHSLGSSLQWQAHDRASLYANAYRSNEYGSGLDMQGLLTYRNGSLSLNHNRSWLDSDRRLSTVAGWTRATALVVNHRLTDRSSFNGRVSHNSGVISGFGLDLAFNHRHTLFGSDAIWRASIFDRPTSRSSGDRRNRGVDITVNLALGSNGRRYNGSLGTRTGANGRRDLYGTVGLQQDLNNDYVRMVSANATGDRYGLSASAGAQFQHRLFSGDTYLQRSSFDGQFSGGLNLQSSIAIGGGKLSAGNHAMTSGAHTGVILDVESDLPEIALRADEHRGSTTMLKPGRNFIPVSAYKAGHMQIDFDGRDVPAAAIHPSSVDFHLNKGGVAYRKVTVMRTVTVMGQLFGGDGKPLRGAQVRNHAGRSVSEVDGFFTLEMSASQPTIDIEHSEVEACRFELDSNRYRREGDTLIVGALKCEAVGSRLVQANNVYGLDG